MIHLTKQSTIYVACPALSVTGGPEALHQLRYYLEKCGFHAVMAYVSDVEGRTALQCTPQRYQKYLGSRNDSVFLEDVADAEENCIIAYESNSQLLFRYQKIQKMIWWLSVRCHDGDCFIPWYAYRFSKRGYLRCLVETAVEGIKKRRAAYPLKSAVNVCGSKYAVEYLRSRGIRAEYMVEPISKEFLEAGMCADAVGREDIVLYNPGKPSKIMEQLLERKRFCYVPIKNMTPDQIIEHMRRAKLYVDFGDFPGPERMPKEAVYNGCAILVRNHHAARNDFDVAIPSKYKLSFLSPSHVEKKIGQMLSNYEEIISDFEPFREKVQNLERDFTEQLSQIFGDEIQQEGGGGST